MGLLRRRGGTRQTKNQTKQAPAESDFDHLNWPNASNDLGIRQPTTQLEESAGSEIEKAVETPQAAADGRRQWRGRGGIYLWTQVEDKEAEETQQSVEENVTPQQNCAEEDVGEHPNPPHTRGGCGSAGIRS